MDLAMNVVSGAELQVRQRRRRLALALIVAIAAAAAVVTDSLWTAGGTIHEAIEFTGLALIVLCVVGRTWSTLYIGGRKKHVLVTDGPYSLCRNPLYVFSVTGATGIGLATGSLAVGLLLGAAIWFVFDRIVRHEEAWLGQHHAGAFAAYAAATPRWLPRLSAWRDVESVEAQPERLVITFREALLLLVALPALELVEWAQGSGWLPVLLHLP